MQNGIPFGSEFFIDLTDRVVCKESQESRGRCLVGRVRGERPRHPVDLVCKHVGKGSKSAHVSLGGTACAPLGTQEIARPQGAAGTSSATHFLSPLASCRERCLITSRVQIRFGAFCPAHLRLEVHTGGLLSCSLQPAPQHQGFLQLGVWAADAFCVSTALFGMWGRDHQGLLVYSSSHRLHKKLSQSKNVTSLLSSLYFGLCIWTW